jgi:hypothetical protein
LEITVPVELGEDQRLGEISRIFQSMNRSAYNRLSEGKQHREVELILLERYGVENLLWRRNAIIQAKGMMKSQQVLLPLHVEELEWKIQRVHRKIDRTRNTLKRHGYATRIRKLELKKAEVEAHIKNGTLPKVVFGGRSGIGSEEWRLKRRGQFLSVGDGWNKGNLNTRIHQDPYGSFTLQIRNWSRSDFTVPLQVPERSRRAFEALAEGTLHPVQPLKTDKGVRPYTVRVIRTPNRYLCHVSIPVPEEPTHVWLGEALAAIDVNPTHIDIAIINKHGNLIAAKAFNEPALIYARRNKRLWLASNLVEKAFKWIGFFHADAVVIEKLSLKGVEHGKHANRLIANFMHRKLRELVAVKALRREWILVRVPAAYSSRIAAAKYKPRFPRMSLHQLAAFVLGRRALGFGEQLELDQLKAVAGCVRKRQAWVEALFLHGHRHPYLTPSIPADGRIGMQDPKGRGASDEWVTPRTRYAVKAERMQRLSWLMPPRRTPRRVEAIRDDGWTRAHGGNAPPPLDALAST